MINECNDCGRYDEMKMKKILFFLDLFLVQTKKMSEKFCFSKNYCPQWFIDRSESKWWYDGVIDYHHCFEINKSKSPIQMKYERKNPKISTLHTDVLKSWLWWCWYLSIVLFFGRKKHVC